LESEKTLVQLSHPHWRERVYSRKLEPNRIQALVSRGVAQQTNKDRETDKPGSDGSDSRELATFNAATCTREAEPNGSFERALKVTLPALIEGTISDPGDVDNFQVQVTAGQSLAFEIETPMAGPPVFNPWLTVLDEAGHEVLSNVYRRIGRAFTFYQKTVEPKTLFTFERGGKYYLQIRDITSRKGTLEFAYRLLIRPQVPHVGDIDVCRECRRTLGNVEQKTPIDRINLVAGKAGELIVIADQEEGFAGSLAIGVEGLPQGVANFPGTELEAEKGEPVDEGEKQRFVPKTSSTIITLFASADAPPTTTPQMIRIVGRPVMGGRVGFALQVQEVLLMVVKPAN
jgi:hypothetical protein